ncbi:MAG: prepilin-type N-terminal cleavage/methylation domain-containing protein [Sideroxydans sp.]|nr:prepilin-type N-terminal cleavage/methylation domain-containing protein [Sideroxydans sp.]
MRSQKYPARQARGNSIGVTLIELLVVLAILAILASIAIPGMGMIRATSDLNDAQRNLAQLLRNAKGLAVARGLISTVTITPATVTLTLSDGSTITGVSGTPATSTLAIPTGIQISTGNAVVMFDSAGTLISQPAGAVNLAITATQYTLAARTINISPLGAIESR